LLRSANASAQAGVYLGKLNKIAIWVPPIEEQRRIAAILDKADAIRRKREDAIELADKFLRSLFVDMFGDPLHNPKGLRLKQLSHFGKVITGNTPPRENPENYGEHIEWIKSDNLNTPFHLATKAAECLSEVGLRRARTVPSGSILVTCIAGSPDCIGNAAMVDREVAFNQQINAVVPHTTTDSYFLYAQLLVGKRLIQTASTASMKGMVSKSRFEQIPLLAPAFEEQQRFGARARKALDLDARVHRLGAESEQLGRSLAQRTFPPFL